MKEVIKEARSVDEAIELACRELGVARDEIDFEIITLPKRGFLGLRNTPAKVRVCMQEPEPPKPQPKKVQQPVCMEKSAAKPEPKVQAGQPKTESKQIGIAPEKKVQEEKIKTKKEESASQSTHTDLEFLPSQTVTGKAKTAVEYVHAVLCEMGVNPEITVAKTENGIILRLSGEGLGVIIGRRGETLDALQYLSGLVANREEGDYMRVTIDSGNYREKRERTLEKLAQKLSASAIRYGRVSTLEPMNPYERRIIHAAVSKIKGVSSSSIGEEPNRRVVITPDRLKPQKRSGRGGTKGGHASHKNDGNRLEHRNGENHPNEHRGKEHRNERESLREKRGETMKPTSIDVDRAYMKELDQQPFLRSEEESTQPKEKTAPVRTKTLHEGEDLPLYGKIDI